MGSSVNNDCFAFNDISQAQHVVRWAVLLQSKDYPFEVLLPDGLPVSRVVLADQIKSLDWRVLNAEWKGKFFIHLKRNRIKTFRPKFRHE